MTKIWGPMGWMTLHSISLNYPENPVYEDKLIVKRFLDKFAESITCNSCKVHFQAMYQSYIRSHPDWADSRFDLFLFMARAHNTVNKRLDKPLIRTVSDCLETIKSNVRNTSLSQFRYNYIHHVIRNWVSTRSGEGMIFGNAAREMDKINNEYWNLRETDLNTVSFPEEDITTSIEQQRPSLSAAIPGMPNIRSNIGFKMVGGRLSLGGR